MKDVSVDRQNRVPAREGWALASLSLTIFIISALRHTPSNSPGVFYRPFFWMQYGNGIYRYRVVGRELIVALSTMVNSLTGGPRITGLSAASFHVEASVFTAFVLVNGASLLALTLLIQRVTARSKEWLPAAIVLIVIVAESSYVVTPYDFLSYLLIVAGLLTALRPGRKAWVVSAALAVLGTATRESYFVVVAALLAVRLSEPNSWRTLHFRPRRTDPLWMSTEAAAAAAVVTYVGLRVFLSRGSDASTFFQSFPGRANFNGASLVAAAVVALSAVALGTLLPGADTRDPLLVSRRRRSLHLLWLLSSPYLVVSALGGIWSEALRLVLPVALCHYVIAWYFSEAGPSPHSPASLSTGS